VRRQLRDAVVGWDFGVGLVVGGGTVALGTIASVRADAVTIHITEAAICAGLLATILGGLAIFATFFDAGYRRVLEHADRDGLAGAVRPYLVVSIVAGAGTIVGVVAAIADPAVGGLGAAFVLGGPTLLCAWAVAGCVSLAELTLFHAKERAALLRGAEDAAESFRRRRVSERARGSEPTK
jgi:hypothetical protein